MRRMAFRLTDSHLQHQDFNTYLPVFSLAVHWVVNRRF